MIGFIQGAFNNAVNTVTSAAQNMMNTICGWMQNTAKWIQGVAKRIALGMVKVVQRTARAVTKFVKTAVKRTITAGSYFRSWFVTRLQDIEMWFRLHPVTIAVKNWWIDGGEECFWFNLNDALSTMFVMHMALWVFWFAWGLCITLSAPVLLI